jgi:hypothetical protein
MTLDQVYRWRLLLEEYGPKIVCIKGIHNTVADTISRLEYDPSANQTAENYHLTKVKKRSSILSQRQSWMTVSKHWCNQEIVISRLDMYRTNALMYHTMVLLVHPAKVRR